nr:hypothetical protein [uncultured Albidiferax sp.]
MSFLPETFIDWLEACAKTLVIVGTVVGAGWGYFEYRHKEEQRRIEGSLTYVKRFSEGNMLESTRRIGSVWYSAQSQLQKLQDSPPGDEYARRHRQLVMSVIEHGSVEDKDGKITRGVVADVDAVTAFFGELAICVNAGLCESQTAHSFFDDYARRFHCLHEPYLVWKAADYSSDYGKDLATFATRDSQKCRSQ